MVTVVAASATGIAVLVGWAAYLALLWMLLRRTRRWWRFVFTGYLTIGVGIATYGLLSTMSDVSATEPALTIRVVADQMLDFWVAVAVWPLVTLYALIGD